MSLVEVFKTRLLFSWEGYQLLNDRFWREMEVNVPPIFNVILVRTEDESWRHSAGRKLSCSGVAETTIEVLRAWAPAKRSATLLLTLIGFPIACSTLAKSKS
jgi:hypothetical protein